jgi:hypothetical protein
MKTMERPFTPPGFDFTVEYCGEVYAAAVTPGFPGVFGGPPDGWEPPEPGNIDEVARWNSDLRDWEILSDEELLSPNLEAKIWEQADIMTLDRELMDDEEPWL